MRPFFSFFVFLVALFGAVHPTFADDPSLNRDRPLIFPTIASKLDLLQLARQLESAGVSFSNDSFVYGLFHLGMGMSYPVSQNFNITVMGGQIFRLGMSFK